MRWDMDGGASAMGPAGNFDCDPVAVSRAGDFVSGTQEMAIGPGEVCGAEGRIGCAPSSPRPPGREA